MPPAPREAQHRRAETPDEDKVYEITLFSVCCDSIFCSKCKTEICLKEHAERLTGEAWKHTGDTLISNLAYVTHHKHAHSLATNREVERERRGEKIFTKIKEKQTSKRGNHQRTEQEGRHAGEQRETNAGEQTPSQRVQNRDDAKRGKHQTFTFKSHQRSFFHGILLYWQVYSS